MVGLIDRLVDCPDGLDHKRCTFRLRGARVWQFRARRGGGRGFVSQAGHILTAWHPCRGYDAAGERGGSRGGEGVPADCACLWVVFWIAS